MLGATAVAAVVLGQVLRSRLGPRRTSTLLRALAVLLVGAYIAFWTVDLIRGEISARTDLPLDLSDLVVFVAGYALWRPSQIAFELTYFWGFTATIQALVTPSLGQSFPDYRWWWFTIAHGGVIVAAVVLAWGRRRTPRAGAVWRVLAISALVAVAVGIADLILDANYMFLRRTPREASLLDLMGPWPLYLFGAAMLAALLFWLLDLPFRARRRYAEKPA